MEDVETPSRNRAPAGTQAILRAINLLKAFSTDRPELSLAQLHAASGLTKPTAHRLLCALQSEGFVERSGPQGSFRLGPALVALGSQAMLTSDLRAAVHPTLKDLARQTGETTTLEVLVDDSMLILDAVKGSHLVTGSLGIGTRWPVHATSTGKSILAAIPEESIEAVVGTSLERYTDRTVTDPTRLFSELEVIRTRGYSAVLEELELDFVAVAASFNDAYGNVEGAISVGGPASRFTPEVVQALGESLLLAAKQLSTRHQARPTR